MGTGIDTQVRRVEDLPKHQVQVSGAIAGRCFALHGPLLGLAAKSVTVLAVGQCSVLTGWVQGEAFGEAGCAL